MRLAVFASMLLACALAGCAAATPGSDANALDDAHMQAVERAARLHGVTVVWLNAPRKVGSGS